MKKKQLESLDLDEKDVLFELKQIELEREGIQVAAWRKEKSLRQRKQQAEEALEQFKVLRKQLEDEEK